ncbi:MAG: hypothetical protein MN733_43245 [Nitrososphaera sp.]|nr:hypothetical protein [Nitrososphaera sp.]
MPFQREMNLVAHLVEKHDMHYSSAVKIAGEIYEEEWFQDILQQKAFK